MVRVGRQAQFQVSIAFLKPGTTWILMLVKRKLFELAKIISKNFVANVFALLGS